MKIHAMFAVSLAVSLSACGKPESVSSIPAANPAPVVVLPAQISVPAAVVKPAPAVVQTAPVPETRAEEQARAKKEYQEVIMNSPHASSKEQLMVIEEKMRQYGYKTK